MRLLIVLLCTILLIFSSSILSIEYTYSPPISAEISEVEFAQWQEEFTNQVSVVEQLIQSSGKADSPARYLNRLIFEASPYLLRHSLNPVNWFPWQADILANAKRQNKLIFLSIGYSTCHWCHVMEKESFTDPSIAKILNQSFISIKIDRELAPDVDLFFTQTLELTKGSAGWPINAILTPNADVVWLDSYLSPAQFAKTLNQLSKVWQVRPQAVEQVAKNLAGQIKGQSRLSDIAWNIDHSKQVVRKLINNLDSIHGGISGERKFPSASAIQLLLYQYQLKPEEQLKIHILRFLDRLANRGIRDHVNGGFYRYSTDVMWQQPHFEKMLYNQALLISTFSKAYQIFQDEAYKSVVIDTIDFVQKWFLSSDGGYYSGIDADYLGSEGLYYIYSAKELALLEPKLLNKFNWCNYNASDLMFPCSYNIIGSNSSNFSVNHVQNKIITKPIESISSARKSLLSIKSRLGKPHIDKKVITAWNALMITAYVDAYKAFNYEHFLEKAVILANTLNSKHISQSGNLMRARYQNKLTGKAVINDYAYLANAMLELFQLTHNQTYYQSAVQYYHQGGLLFGKNYLGQNSVVNNLLNDGELVSAHAVLLSLGSQLTHYGEKTSVITKPQIMQLKQAVMTSIGGDFSIHEFFLKNKYGVFDNKQHFAKGKGEIHLTVKDGTALFSVRMAKGWHINSNKPLQGFLIPTQITGKNDNDIVAEAIYPLATIKTLGFNQEKLSLFEDEFILKAILNNSEGRKDRIEVSLQACSDKLCLLPEKLSFYLSGK